MAGRAPGALILCAALAAAGPPQVRAAVVEEIAASVNGQIITRSELLARETQVMSQLSSRLVGDELERQSQQARGSLLTDMIREVILLQRAEILGLELDKVYQQALTQLKDQQGIKNQEELEELLKQEGISKEDLKDTLLRFNVPDIMVNLEVREKISVTDEEAAERFASNREKYRVEESFAIQEIVLTQEGRTAQELKDLAAKVVEELRGGTSFNELVVKYSQAPSRFNDGKIGPLKRGELAADLEAAALALKPGEVSEPLPTKAGIHIIRLESYTAAKEPSLEDARPKIITELKQEKFVAALDTYFKMLLETNRITINPNYKQYAQES
jgi:parvulin-like peptidyl-prolyl isomerase